MQTFIGLCYRNVYQFGLRNISNWSARRIVNESAQESTGWLRFIEGVSEQILVACRPFNVTNWIKSSWQGCPPRQKTAPPIVPRCLTTNCVNWQTDGGERELRELPAALHLHFYYAGTDVNAGEFSLFTRSFMEQKPVSSFTSLAGVKCNMCDLLARYIYVPNVSTGGFLVFWFSSEKTRLELLQMLPGDNLLWLCFITAQRDVLTGSI